ncbi:MAG: hypothetical protein ACYTXE_45230 [Nostoc sp.]
MSTKEVKIALEVSRYKESDRLRQGVDHRTIKKLIRPNLAEIF